MIDTSGTLQAAVTIALLLLAAHAVGRLFASLKLPRVIGEIVGGLLLGPTLVGHFFPGFAQAIMPAAGSSGVALLGFVSQVGLVLLMYASGAQLRSFVEPSERKVVAVLATVGVLIPFVIGLVAIEFLDNTPLIGAANSSTAFLLVFATAIAVASIPVISRIMMDLGIMETPFARIVISTAVIDDLVLYVVLAIALGLAQSRGAAEYGLPTLLELDPAGVWSPAYHVLAAVALIGLTLFGGNAILNRMLGRRIPGLRGDSGAGVHMLFLVVVTALSKFLAVNPMFGALAAGMMAGRVSSQRGLGTPRSIQKIGQWVFIPLYFAIVGFKLDLIHHFDAAFFCGFLTFACAVKAASIYAGARFAGESPGTALNLAAALNARGGPGIVLASVAFEAHIINENFFAMLVLLAIVTSLLAGSWLGTVVRGGGDLRWRFTPIDQRGPLA